MNADCRLATYGTLGPGRQNHHELLGLSGHWSQGAVRGDLHNAGWGATQGYPGLILKSSAEAVAVDLFSSDDLPDHWSRLDAFEGGGYRRVVTQVTTSYGIVDACIYVLREPAP